MGKTAILKRAKQDPTFRKQVIAILQQKAASSGLRDHQKQASNATFLDLQIDYLVSTALSLEKQFEKSGFLVFPIGKPKGARFGLSFQTKEEIAKKFLISMDLVNLSMARSRFKTVGGFQENYDRRDFKDLDYFVWGMTPDMLAKQVFIEFKKWV